MERYHGSEHRRTETYMTRTMDTNPNISATPPVEEINFVDSEVAPDFMVDQGLYYPAASYYGYYCTGFESTGEWDDQNRFLGLEGQDLQYPGLQAESLPYVYYTPSYGYAQSPYNPYNPYIPGAFFGVDGQLVGTQQYYSGAPNQNTASSHGYLPVVMQSSSDVLPSGSAEPTLPNTGMSSAGAKHILTQTSLTTVTGTHSTAPVDVKMERGQTSSLQIPQSFAKQGRSQGTMPSKNAPNSSSSQFSQVRSVPGSIQDTDHFSLGRVPPIQNSVIVTLPAANGLADFGSSGHGWAAIDKLRPRLQFGGVWGNRTGNLDVLTEQNRGPRTYRSKNQWASPISNGAYTAKAGSSNSLGNIVISADQYNRDDFPVKYHDAKFFVIKSYSEDDVHKSIKYSVWSSTPNGNKRLDSAFEDAQRRSGGKAGNIPVFLFFSVNASGQFCGVAEMIGPVDFYKDMDFWQQDKWSGSFPVKWHIIKDVPNANFRHIILENNEDKPVTNSRDTQEIMYTKGIEMLNIFKNYSLKTSLLDDFMYYEDRQKVMQEKKSRLQSKRNEGLYILPSYVPPSKPSKSVDQQAKPNAMAAEHEDLNNPGSQTSGDGHVISKISVTDSSSENTTQQTPAEDANDVISFMKIGSLSIDPNRVGTINSGAINSVTSGLKIGSLSIGQKGSGTTDAEAIKVDTSPNSEAIKVNSSLNDVVTVGSMPVKVNGFGSPGMLTIGTISIDPEALKLNNKQSILTNRSTT